MSGSHHAWCPRSRANLKWFRSSLCPQQGTQTYRSQETPPAPTETQGGKRSGRHCQRTHTTTGAFPNTGGRKGCSRKGLALVFTSYSLIVPFHVQPLLMQTAGRLSTSRRAALSGKA